LLIDYPLEFADKLHEPVEFSAQREGYLGCSEPVRGSLRVAPGKAHRTQNSRGLLAED